MSNHLADKFDMCGLGR
jgi:hypothetical protein